MNRGSLVAEAEGGSLSQRAFLAMANPQKRSADAGSSAARSKLIQGVLEGRWSEKPIALRGAATFSKHKVKSPSPSRRDSPPQRQDISAKKTLKTPPQDTIQVTANVIPKPADKIETIFPRRLIPGPSPRAAGEGPFWSLDGHSLQILSDSLKRLDESMASRARKKVRGMVVLEKLLDLHDRRYIRSGSFDAWQREALCRRALSLMAARSSSTCRIAVRSLNTLFDQDTEHTLRVTLHAWYRGPSPRSQKAPPSRASSPPSWHLATNILPPHQAGGRGTRRGRTAAPSPRRISAASLREQETVPGPPPDSPRGPQVAPHGPVSLRGAVRGGPPPPPLSTRPAARRPPVGLWASRNGRTAGLSPRRKKNTAAAIATGAVTDAETDAVRATVAPPYPSRRGPPGTP